MGSYLEVQTKISPSTPPCPWLPQAKVPGVQADAVAAMRPRAMSARVKYMLIVGEVWKIED